MATTATMRSQPMTQARLSSRGALASSGQLSKTSRAATRDARRVRNVPRSPGKKASPVSLAVDDFLMYFSIVVSLHFCWWEFILGTTIGAICIATALGTCLWCSPRLADKVASLPLVPVVVIMAIYIAVQAFVPAMNPSPRNSAGAC